MSVSKRPEEFSSHVPESEPAETAFLRVLIDLIFAINYFLTQIFPKKGLSDEEAQVRFVQEAQRLQKLQHFQPREAGVYFPSTNLDRWQLVTSCTYKIGEETVELGRHYLYYFGDIAIIVTQDGAYYFVSQDAEYFGFESGVNPEETIRAWEVVDQLFTDNSFENELKRLLDPSTLN